VTVTTDPLIVLVSVTGQRVVEYDVTSDVTLTISIRHASKVFSIEEQTYYEVTGAGVTVASTVVFPYIGMTLVVV
jgi:hypothetical protein